MPYKEGLNASQLAAVEHGGSHLLLLAGAGSGKTKTIVAKTAHLVATGVAPQRVLLLTFTRRAASEMKARLSALLGDAAKDVVAGTFHFFCLSVIHRMPQAFGIGDTTIIDADDQMSLMKLVRSEIAEGDKEFPAAKAIIDWYSYSRNTNMELADYLEHFTSNPPELNEQLVKVCQEYEARKQKNNYLDFDDILQLFAKRIHEEPRIRQQLSALFDHILVDEMQDTNPVQWRILEGLMDPALLFCVGDDAQSIYAFRGADFRNVHSFAERVPGGQVMKLEDNYRSTQGILDVSNWLLKQASLDYDKELRAVRGPGIKPRMLDFPDEFEEARWVAADLIKRHNEGAPWRDHMILTRTAWGARTLEGILAEQKIPYRFVGGTSLFKSAHVKDLLALLRVAHSHYDELAWLRYLTCWPKVGATRSARAIASIVETARPEEALEVIRKSFKDLPQMAQAIGDVRELSDSPAAAVSCALDMMREILKKRYDHWDRRIKDLDLLAKLAEEHGDLRTFIETFTLDPLSSTAAEHSATDDVVTVITVHSAKGTEAPVCYIIQAQPGIYPHSKSLDSDDKIEEERRILYVAITRAQDELIFTRNGSSGGGQRDRWGDCCSLDELYFLGDVPDDLLHCTAAARPRAPRNAFASLFDFSD